MEKQYIDLTDEEILCRYKAGDISAGEYLLNRYKTLVRKKARLYYLDGGDQEDLLQEGMLGLFKAMKEYNAAKPASFFTFAELCVTHQMLSAIEWANRKKHSPLNQSVSIDGLDEMQVLGAMGSAEDPETIIMEQEAARRLLEEWKKDLSSMEKKVLDMYLDGYDYLQIARRMGKSGKSIDNCLQRIKAKVRKKREGSL